MDVATNLLRASDPLPVEIVNEASDSKVVLVCEHAGREIPAALGNLGVQEEDMQRHIAYDVGAADVAIKMADILDAPLLLQPYSRLVVDCNRPVDAHDAIPESSDGTEIPGNRNLTISARQMRFDEIFTPFHQAVSAILEQIERQAVFAIHSFTPVLGKEERPWDLAFLFRKDQATSAKLAAAVRRLDPSATIGMNVPYAIDDKSDWFVPHHGEGRGLAHSLIEIRNDHLNSDQSCRSWAALLSGAIKEFLAGGRP